MSDSEYLLYFEQSNIAEINSLSLNEFEKSFREFFLDTKKSTFNSSFITEFGHIKFSEINNPLMNDFEKAFLSFFFLIL